jgi:hypothetical protein
LARLSISLSSRVSSAAMTFASADREGEGEKEDSNLFVVVFLTKLRSNLSSLWSALVIFTQMMASQDGTIKVMLLAMIKDVLYVI